MANTLALWKGAVEPNDLGAASGNELILDKGAVQVSRSYTAPVVATATVSGRSKGKRPRYVVEVDGQTLVADSAEDAKAILEAAAETAQKEAVRLPDEVIKSPPRLKVTTKAGRKTTSKAIQDAVSKAQSKVDQAYKKIAEERRLRIQVDREISARMQRKIQEEDDEEAITVLLLS